MAERVKIVTVSFNIVVPETVAPFECCGDLLKCLDHSHIADLGYQYHVNEPLDGVKVFEIPDRIDTDETCVGANEQLKEFIARYGILPRTEDCCCYGKCQDVRSFYTVPGFAICRTCGWATEAL